MTNKEINKKLSEIYKSGNGAFTVFKNFRIEYNKNDFLGNYVDKLTIQADGIGGVGYIYNPTELKARSAADLRTEICQYIEETFERAKKDLIKKVNNGHGFDF